MTGLLTAAAIITTLVLLLSASRTGAAGTPGDLNHRGSWGIVDLTLRRRRNLNPHERRWQTVLLSGRDNPSRWKDLVAEIEALQRLRGITATKPAPDSHDNAWIEAQISTLENAIDDLDATGEIAS